MANIKSIAGGGIAIIFGLLGLIGWWGNFIAILKGGLPVLLLFGGAILLVTGINENKPPAKTEKEEEKNKS